MPGSGERGAKIVQILLSINQPWLIVIYWHTIDLVVTFGCANRVTVHDLILMLAYVQALINIALRRSGPEDLPDSTFLLGLTLALYLVAQLPLALIAYGPSDILLRTVAVSLLLLFSGLWILLRLTGYRARYRRTVTAMLGTSALLSILSIPFSVWRQSMLSADSNVAMPSTFLFALMLWSLFIDGHILSRALSRPFGIGLLISIGYFFLHTSLLYELIPDVAGTTQ